MWGRCHRKTMRQEGWGCCRERVHSDTAGVSARGGESKNCGALLNLEDKQRQRHSDRMSWSARRCDNSKRESTRHSLDFSYRHSTFQRWSRMKTKRWAGMQWPKKSGQEIRMFWRWSFHKMIKVKMTLMSHAPKLCMWGRPTCGWDSRRRGLLEEF